MTTDAPPAKKVKTPAGAKKPKANGDSTPAPANGSDGKFSQSEFHFAFNLRANPVFTELSYITKYRYLLNKLVCKIVPIHL